MAPVTNGRLLFNEIPKGYPEPGKTTVYDAGEQIDVESVPLSGGFLLRVLVLSIDPYLRGKMRDASVKSYSPPFVVGEPLANWGVGVVVRSENPAVKVGEHLYGLYPFQHYVVKDDLTQFRVLKNKENLPWSAYVGAAGMPGQTAYYAWKEHSKAVKGETVFVTTGAGPVGSLVAQLAKLDGLKVIASAGSDEKVNFMKDIGVDVAFNYKTTKTSEVLAKEGPINVYWDNVGGETLDAALEAAAPGARFIVCGMISGYNGAQYVLKNSMCILTKQLSITGFLVFHLASKYSASFYSEVPAKLASGELKYSEDITKGLENAGDAILAVQQGTNTGKSVILVAEE